MVAAALADDDNPDSAVESDINVESDPTTSYFYTCSGGGATMYVRHIHNKVDVPAYVWCSIVVALLAMTYNLVWR